MDELYSTAITVIKNFLRRFYFLCRGCLLFPLLFFRRLRALRQEDVGRVLILRHDRIGDMVLATGFLEGIKSRYPKARITVLASARNHEILRNNPCVDEILIYKGWSCFLKEVRGRSVDLAIDLFYSYELRPALLTFFSGAKFRIGFEKAGREIFFNLKGPCLRPAGSMSEHFCELLSCLKAEAADYSPKIYLDEQERNAAVGLSPFIQTGRQALVIAVHPGGYYSSQRWPVENFAAVAKRLLDEFGARIVAVGDKSERELLRQFEQKVNSKYARVFFDLSLRQTMALLAGCRLLVCNNSGILHIAAALKIPTVSIMGPTEPQLWRPWGSNHIVLRKDLWCSPCGRAYCRRHDCMRLITVSEVLRAAEGQIRLIHGSA